MKKLHITTLGCKVNQHESAVVADHFHRLGYEFSTMEEADLIFINTCTVTNRTDYKSRNLIRKALQLKETKPTLRIFVTGCYSQRSFEELKELEGLDLIIDNQYKTDVSAWLDTLDYNFTDIMEADSYHHIPFSGMLDRTRAFQKIQDGCDFYCSYCAVPYARGHSRSCRFDDVVNQARVLVTNAYKEIVLGGINLGLYRDQSRTLKDVIKALDALEGLELIRLSSIEPQLITEDLLDLVFALDKVCPHFHIPLQSGSDSVLQRMGRRYKTADLTRLIASIRSRYEDVAIGMDVITAFPGETALEFEETLELIQSLEVSYLHVFTYSKRKGTQAAKMKDQVHGTITNQRSKTLSALSEKMKGEYRDRLIRKKTLLRGIAEDRIGEQTTALSDHFVRIYTNQDTPLNQMMTITATQTHLDGISD